MFINKFKFQGWNISFQIIGFKQDYGLLLLFQNLNSYPIIFLFP